MARVLYLITSSGVGGTETFLLRLLQRLDRARFEPVVVSVKPAGATAKRIGALGVEVLSLQTSDETGPFGALELLLAARRLPQLLGRRRFDLVHSLLWRANLIARLAARRLGARALVNSYRSSVEAETGWHLRADRWTARRVDRFHLQSAALATALQQRLAAGADRCAVIPNGVDLAEADAGLAIGRTEARRRLGLFPTDLAVVCLSRLHAEKGISHLLGAFHALAQAQPTARLLIAGDGPARRTFEAQTAGLRLGVFVRFLGEVPEPWPLLAAADLFALPSLWEGMPNALLEAMAAGVPAVATAVGAVPEMVTDRKEALLVPPADPGALARALAELSSNPRQRREIGAAARQRVEKAYRLEATVAALESLYADRLGAAA